MANVKEMKVDVVAKNVAGGIDFKLDEKKGKGPRDEIDLDNDNHPGIAVYFNLKDSTGTKLVFRPDPADALWVNFSPPGGPLPPCPTGPTAWDGFIPLSVEKKGRQLIVYCRNLDSNQKFKFALRFLEDDGKGCPQDYDPIGNGNNGMRE